jgi:carboxylesterase type B
MTSSSTTFKHSALGTIKGVSPIPKVVQYRCIPFASIPARFKHSKLIDHVGDFDATKYGYPISLGSANCSPICPQMVGFVENQGRGWGGEGGPECAPLDEVELDCLRLTITAPEGHKPGQNLPVMVWVHG